MPRPVVSIVIPTFNTPFKQLAAAVSSALNQTVPVEVIVVDDGSDEPRAFLGPTRVIWRRENGGIARALNTGIVSMRTDWFCWLSADDLISADKVEHQLKALTESGCKAGFHPYEVVDPDGKKMGYGAPPLRLSMDFRRLQAEGKEMPDWWTWGSMAEQRLDFSRNCWVNGSTCMIHRSVIDDVGMVDESFRWGQDWDWWVRIGQKYKWCFVNRILGRRTEGGNLTEKIMADPEMRAVKEAEDRRIMEWANARIYG